MKISCPNCGKTYAVPQKLIDAILEQERPSAFGGAEFFATVPHTRNLAKLLMLGVTILWPIGTGILAFWSISSTLADTQEFGNHYVLNHGFGEHVTFGEIVVTSIYRAIMFGTIAWVLTMAFLTAIWFATRR